MLMHQFSLTTFGAQRQCCNLQCVYIRSLQFIFSDLRRLVAERVSTGSISLLYFFARLYWCRRQSDLSHLTSTEEDSAGSS